jgi:hypothetical protein
VIDYEDYVLAHALGELGSRAGGVGARAGAAFAGGTVPGRLSGSVGGGRGARMAARFLKKDVHEIPFDLAVPLSTAVDDVAEVLAGLGTPLPNGASATGASGQTDDAEQVVRALLGGGFGNLNPVVVTVRLSAIDAERTRVVVRGAAKEGLFKQRAGQKTAVRVAQLIDPSAQRD